MTEENKMNFFNRIITSIKDFDKYSIFAAEKTRKAICYLALIILIFSIVIGGVFTYKFSVSINKGIDYFKNNITEVSYIKDNLSINSGEEIKLVNPEEIMPIIIINTNATAEQENEYKDELSRYENGILFLKDKLIYKNEMLSQSMQYSYKDIAGNYGINEFDKEDILTFIANVNNINLYLSFIIAVTIYLFIIYFASTFVDVVMVAVLGFIFARIVRNKITF